MNPYQTAQNRINQLVGVKPTTSKNTFKNTDMITTNNFTRVNSDVNGNPRYVIHFLDLLTREQQDEIRAKARPFQAISDMYAEAVNKARKIGGKRYRGKDYGGGIVFQSFSLTETANSINKLLTV